MTAFLHAFTKVVALFIDDGWLALAIIAVVAIAAILSVVLAPHMRVAAGIVLLAGCLGVLFGNVMRAK